MKILKMLQDNSETTKSELVLHLSTPTVFPELDENFIKCSLTLLGDTKNLSTSEILKDTLSDALLPKHSNARYICKDLFANAYNTFEGLERIFDLYSTGPDSTVRYPDGIVFIKHFKECLLSAHYDMNLGDSGDREYLWKWVQHVNKKLIESGNASSQYNKDDLEFINPYNIPRLFLDNWDIFKHETCTYKTLLALCRLIKNQKIDTANDIIKLIELIKESSKNWDDNY